MVGCWAAIETAKKTTSVQTKDERLAMESSREPRRIYSRTREVKEGNVRNCNGVPRELCSCAMSLRDTINEIRLVAGIAVIIFTAVSGWIVGVRMRRRARRALGRNVSDGELVSLNTWMEVQDAERRENPRTEPPLR